jgi:hypothetical protein
MAIPIFALDTKPGQACLQPRASFTRKTPSQPQGSEQKAGTEREVGRLCGAIKPHLWWMARIVQLLLRTPTTSAA